MHGLDPCIQATTLDESPATRTLVNRVSFFAWTRGSSPRVTQGTAGDLTLQRLSSCTSVSRHARA